MQGLSVKSKVATGPVQSLRNADPFISPPHFCPLSALEDSATRLGALPPKVEHKKQKNTTQKCNLLSLDCRDRLFQKGRDGSLGTATK